MITYQGVPVYPGVAIGKFSVVVSDRVGAQKRVAITQEQVGAELARLDSAFRGANKTLEENREDATRQLGEEFGRLYDAYLLILNDAGLRSRIEKTVSNELVNVEYAVDTTLNQYADRLRGLESRYAERANDVLDLKDRLLHQLLSIRVYDPAETAEPTIVAASFLKPSAAAKLDPDKTAAIVTENGSIGSHTAIVAAAMGVPTILGVGPFLAETKDDTVAIVDGELGRLILDPTPDVLAQYERKLAKLRENQERLAAKARSVETYTSDGVCVEIKGNIEFPNEAKTCFEYGAPGVGLYRTEFLYLTSPNGALPDEETHFQAYKKVVETMQGRPVTIRTFDLGADKLPSGLRFTPDDESNPFMGLRSVRLSLRNGDMFRTQIRAILRASVFGRVQVMFPLVSTARSRFLQYRDERPAPVHYGDRPHESERERALRAGIAGPHPHAQADGRRREDVRPTGLPLRSDGEHAGESAAPAWAWPSHAERFAGYDPSLEGAVRDVLDRRMPRARQPRHAYGVRRGSAHAAAQRLERPAPSGVLTPLRESARVRFSARRLRKMLK